VQLRNRVEELEAEITYLKSHDNNALNAIRLAFGVTIGEARTLLVMSRGGIINNEQIIDAYCDGMKENPILARDAIKRIRKKQPDLTILSHYGFGYELEGDSLKRVRKAISTTENHHND
jgi:DNA-binding response OmpR family regulator